METQTETTWVNGTLAPALKAARDYVYAIENLCSSPEISSKIIQWVRASPDIINQFVEEIDRAYELCLDRAKSTQPTKSSEPGRIFPTEIVDELHNLPSKDWRILSSHKLRDEATNKVYYVVGWDGSNALGPSRIASRLGLPPKGVDAWIFLAHQFSSKSVEEFGSREDVAMISLSNKAISGGLPSGDHLLQEVMNIIDAYTKSPDRIHRPHTIQGPDKVDSMIAAANARHSARVFNEHFRLTDCGHLETGFYGRERLGMSGREPISWYRPMSVEEKLEPYPSLVHAEEDPEKILSEMKLQKEYLVEKLEETLISKTVVPIAKRSMTGKLELDEVRLLCKACSMDFKEVYEFPEDPPFRGLEFVFKGFVSRVAKELQATEEFNEMLDVGVIRTLQGNIVLMMNPPTQPTANIAALGPSLVVVVCNFFWRRWRERRLLMGQVFGFGSGGGRSEPWIESRLVPDDMKVAVFRAVSNYLVACIAYDCESDAYEQMALKPSLASLEKIVERIASIELTVKPTEKAFKAAHDRLLEELKVMGLSFAYDTRTEFPLGPDRLDVAWVNRSTQKVEVAIEVELGSNPTGELWKLVELRPRLAVLAVKGKQYDQTLTRLAKSRILRDEAQTLMVLDVSDRRFVVVRGNDIVRIPTTP